MFILHQYTCSRYLSGFPYVSPSMRRPNSLSLNRLQARDDSDGSGKGDWGTSQIATPAIVGGVLLLVFAAYLIWQRRPHDKRDKRSYDYHQVRPDWIAKIERIFVLRRKRQRVLHSSAPVTLDESMRSSGFMFDYRRSRQYRSDSSDSQTPLTSTSYAFDYPPNQLSDSPPPIPKRRTVRLWWLFGSRPQQVKPEEPGQRWRVDGPDGSSTEHGHSSHGHRYVEALGALHEDPEEVDNDVIRIGEDFTSAASTPMTQHFPEEARSIRGLPTVPEHPSSSGIRTPVPAASASQSNSGTPVSPFVSRECVDVLDVVLDQQVSSANRGLPPSYDVSQIHTAYPSTEDIIRLPPSGPNMAIPPPVRAAGYPSLRAFHGRDLSSDSFLAAQPPMVPPSIY